MPITFKEQTAASVPTPSAGKVTLFIDSADGVGKMKDDTGAVIEFGTISVESVQDIVGSLWADTASIDVTYDDAGNAISAEVIGGGGGAPANVDYLVGTANAGLSAEIVVGTTPGGELGGTWGSPTVDGTHSGSTHATATDTHIADATDAHDASAISIADAGGDFTATHVEGALDELQADNEAHVAAADPHTGYREESADHTHASTGLQAGTVSHDVLTGVSADDHHAESHTLASHSSLDHGVLTGLTDDDHTQYQKESEKGAVSGYASLDGGGTVPDAQIPAAIARDSEVTTAVTDHEAEADPHTGYRLESADHSHASTGLQAGTVSHDVLTGVSADDHHAQSHTHASHTGIGVNDHHTEIHQPSKHDAVGAYVTKTAAQAIPNQTWTLVTWNSEVFDTDTLHDNATNNSRITVPAGMGGLWLASYSVPFYQLSGRRMAEIRKNGAGTFARIDTTAGLNVDLTFGHSAVFQVAAGDYLELYVFQGAGASIDLYWDGAGFGATYLGA